MKFPWNRKPKVQYKIIEIERPRPLAQLDPEAEKTVITLQSHPGFLYLVNKLRLQRHALEMKLKHERHSNLNEVEWIQSGIFWCNWLEDQVNRMVNNQLPSSQTALPPEATAFEEVMKLTEIVGRQ